MNQFKQHGKQAIIKTIEISPFKVALGKFHRSLFKCVNKTHLLINKCDAVTNELRNTKMNFKNIGLLFPCKHVYFVPFSQDSPQKKPCSLVARTELVIPTIKAALKGEQLQPVLYSPD